MAILVNYTCKSVIKLTPVQIRVGNMWYFQRNCFIFKVKILKGVIFSENWLILLQIQFVWNNGGQKHSLGTDVEVPSIQPVFSLLCRIDGLAIAVWVYYPGKIYFISITMIKA